MAKHTNDMLEDYAEAGSVPFETEGNLSEDRKRLFRTLESTPDFLSPKVYTAQGGELWTLKKLLHRILWHDHIHSHALYRRAITFWQKECIANLFCFTAEKQPHSTC